MAGLPYTAGTIHQAVHHATAAYARAGWFDRTAPAAYQPQPERRCLGTSAWLCACYRWNGPFPLLVLLGEQGSAKSTTSRVAKSIVDPSKAPIRSEPKEARDLMISASRSWLLAYDNVSSLPDWLSDALCRLATGGGFATRTLYENSEETVFECKRPVVLNGITDFVTRADLLERSILLHHPPIPEADRKTEGKPDRR